jgi:hypothetical protein
MTDTKTIEIYSAVSAEDGDDKVVLSDAIGAFIVDSLTEDGRDQSKKGVYFHSTDKDKTMVINEVEGRIEDEFIDDDVHLVKVSIDIKIEYL